jgi:hypothetical protein
MTTSSNEEKHEKQRMFGGSSSLQGKDLFGSKHKASRKISDLSDEERADLWSTIKNILAAISVILVVSFFVFNFLTGNSLVGSAPTVKDHWVKKIDLKGLELSQDQVIHGETHSDMFYVDGQVDGKPELFVYYRYVDDSGVVHDKLTPRKDVELVEDLPTGAASYVEFSADYRRVMTKQEWADSHPNHEIFGVFIQIHEGLFINKDKATTEKQSPPCFIEVETCTGNTRTSDVKPKISVHLPKGAIIEHIDPNTIHKGENNKK